MVSETKGLRRTCGLCDKHFYVCMPCDRWHWYCGPGCSQAARKLSLRKARRKYSKSKKGRQTNRLAQENHRKRKRFKNKVSHQSSPPAEPALPPKGAEIQELVLDPSAQSISKEEVHESTRQRLSRPSFPQCVVCGRTITHIPVFDKFKSHHAKELSVLLIHLGCPGTAPTRLTNLTICPQGAFNYVYRSIKIRCSQTASSFARI